MTDYPIPGDDERSFVEHCIGRLKTHRRAEGTVDGYDVLAWVKPRQDSEGKRVWSVRVTVSDGYEQEDMQRAYASHGDATLAFEWLVERHGLKVVYSDDE